MSPEFVSRPIGSYDPNEPFVIPYGDLIAARNAVSELVALLRSTEQPPTETQQLSVMTGVRMAVVPDGEPHEFDTFEETLQWLKDLTSRLTGLLPDLPPGPRESC